MLPCNRDVAGAFCPGALQTQFNGPRSLIVPGPQCGLEPGSFDWVFRQDLRGHSGLVCPDKPQMVPLYQTLTPPRLGI